MTLHRLQAFVTFERDNSWDLLVGTGPLKNSLRIDIKLGSGVAVSHAPSVLGMDTQEELERMLGSLYANPLPWEGCRVKLWDNRADIVSGPYRWKNQRLYKDKNDTARLCCIVKHHDLTERPSLEHVPVEFARCGEQKWVREDQLTWPNWLGIDQKMYQNEEDDEWMFMDSYTTHIPSNKRNVVYPRRTGPMIDNSRLRMLQDKVKELQKYPSGEVTGILMWDLSKRVFCVQPESATQYIDLMESTLDHAAVYNSQELLQELQFPHWYESAGVWEYQLLRYLQPVEMPLLRDGLYQAWLRDGQNRPPLELVKLESKPIKFYPVDDGIGGGKVFADNASAQEYLHLGEGRKMLRRADTRESGLDAIGAEGRRRSPPPRAHQVTTAFRYCRRGRTFQRDRRPISCQAVEAATRVREASAQSSRTWLTADQAKELQSHSDVTVFMVKYVDRRDRPVLFQLGECYARRGLANPHEVSGRVSSRYNKTIACATSGWHLPLGGQTKSPDLLGAVKLAFDDLIQFGGEGRRAHTCVMMLGTHMTFRSAHVLRCRESPTAKPVYYIFEDDERAISDRAQFAESYLVDEDRKFTLLRYVTEERAAPWVRPALKLLEERLHPPSAVGAQALRARVAERPEHMDRDEEHPTYSRRRALDSGVQQLGTRAGIPAPTTPHIWHFFIAPYLLHILRSDTRGARHCMQWCATLPRNAAINMDLLMTLRYRLRYWIVLEHPKPEAGTLNRRPHHGDLAVDKHDMLPSHFSVASTEV
ncbi:hypothetical protein CYMTET_51678 [Cymbomonas tetramitiformis]|uniref:Uncharacterized protein n=1 Tax=Cymbomonas tetramitiformis TaxID=36881 RepID=A0AAE0BKJ0_9CHLO|nr:hypothetical protein CYMTET_51678 [Cymbomonas tetramitiformis]